MKNIILTIMFLIPSIVNGQSMSRFYDYFCLEDTILYEGQILEIPEVFIQMNDPSNMKHYYVSFDPVFAFLKAYPNARVEIRIHNAWNLLYEGTPYSNQVYDIPEMIADSVKLNIIGKGISPERIEANGYSLEFPIIANKKHAESSEYIEVGDTLDLAKLERVIRQMDKDFTNKKGKRIHKRKYEQKHMDFRGRMHTANQREEIKIIEM